MVEEPEQILTPCSSGRRRSYDSNSPEFEFWMGRNPSLPQPNLHSADELFSDGVLLPLQNLHIHQDPEPSGSDHPAGPDPQSPELSGATATITTAEVTEASASSALTSSRRWRDIIFKKNDKKTSYNKVKSDDNGTAKCKDSNNIVAVKEKKRDKKNGGVGAGNGAELNINIWPFSRSRSAGNGGTRPRSAAAGGRKVSSAPCSRSNSAGESKSRKWPSSPGRAAGVHLGRTSPVWQVRRSGGGGARGSEVAAKKEGNEGRRKVPLVGSGTKGKVLSLNVPMCIGYRAHLSCKSDENSAVNIAAAAADGGSGGSGGVAGEGVRGNNMFSIRSLFTKKVY